MKQVGAQLVAVEASKEAGGADLPGGLGQGPGAFFGAQKWMVYEGKSH